MLRFLPKKSKTPVPEIAVPIAGGTLHLHELRSRIFKNSRFVRVWTPPGYGDPPGTRYPVLYLNDGQNLFEASTAFGGMHWQVGETAGRLIAEKKMPPLVIVGIDNTGKNRIREYLPWRSPDVKTLIVRGKLYPNFLQREVIPLVESQYALLSGPENTALGGSSLGGLITLYTQLVAPGVFGRLLIESPSLGIAHRKIISECRRFREWPERVYLGMGTRELGDAKKDEKIANDARELAALIGAAGLDERRLKVNIEEGASHSESSWARRLPGALEFIYS
ncbi:MAG TPA: alpha/beta hydrolase-fold protein [Terriglobales bacterium]|nr:alpha/beta hydrolase-fold protein [Terriglobales bacterium]